jgi:RNA polymerase sigma-70 factor, ECF subfamily
MLRPMNTAHISETCPAEDLRLVVALRRGDEQAFAELVERYERLMLAVATGYAGTRAVAQEVVQDTWLSVFKSIHSFECRSSLKTWIFRILVNRAKTRGAGESRSIPFSSFQPDGSDSFDPESLIDRSRIDAAEAESPDQVLVSRETFDHALRAIEQLPDSQRRVIAMRDLQGCPSDEVCSSLGITSGNQRVQLHRARAAVARDLASYLSATTFRPSRTARRK